MSDNLNSFDSAKEFFLIIDILINK